ncbi:MAG: hypothetical protein QM831_43035 [Kofleriaceae bacterium]
MKKLLVVVLLAITTVAIADDKDPHKMTHDELVNEVVRLRKENQQLKDSIKAETDRQKAENEKLRDKLK